MADALASGASGRKAIGVRVPASAPSLGPVCAVWTNQQLFPILVAVRLVPLTDEAIAALGGRGEVPIPHLPFTVGRKSKAAGEADPEDRNDLALIDRWDANALHISKHHFVIEQDGPGFVLVDCYSSCGTTVNGQQVGGHRQGGRVELPHGAVIVVGAKSKYAFRFEESPRII